MPRVCGGSLAAREEHADPHRRLGLGLDEYGTSPAVIIFLNAARFLGGAIASVLAQTYQNGMMLVDDGSSDGTTGIARCYCAASPGQVRRTWAGRLLEGHGKNGR